MTEYVAPKRSPGQYVIPPNSPESARIDRETDWDALAFAIQKQVLSTAWNMRSPYFRKEYGWKNTEAENITVILNRALRATGGSGNAESIYKTDKVLSQDGMLDYLLSLIPQKGRKRA